MPRYIVTLQLQVDVRSEAESALDADTAAREWVKNYLQHEVQALREVEVTDSWVDNDLGVQHGRDTTSIADYRRPDPL